MEKLISNLRKIYFMMLGQFLVMAGLVLTVKMEGGIEDYITLSNKLTHVAPILMIVFILASYGIYDRIAKKSQKLDDENEQMTMFKKASIIRFMFFDLVGLLISVMIFLLYQKTYIYMLGIIFVFFLINYPKEVQFKKDFKKDDEFFYK